MKCPRCGFEYQLPLTPRQQDTMDVLQRGALLSTQHVADLLVVDYKTAYTYLRYLEKLGYVERPHGPRSGWMMAREIHRLHLQLVA